MVALYLWPGKSLISHIWFQNVCIDCSAVPQMDLKENPEERKQQIYAILDDPKSTSQNRVEMYDKWCKHYDQVINSPRQAIRFCSVSQVLDTNTKFFYETIVDYQNPFQLIENLSYNRLCKVHFLQSNKMIGFTYQIY